MNCARNQTRARCYGRRFQQPSLIRKIALAKVETTNGVDVQACPKLTLDLNPEILKQLITFDEFSGLIDSIRAAGVDHRQAFMVVRQALVDIWAPKATFSQATLIKDRT